jgi:hypothetical protein
MFGALLAEQNEAWQSRRYLDMDEFNEWLMEPGDTLAKTKGRINMGNLQQKSDLNFLIP